MSIRLLAILALVLTSFAVPAMAQDFNDKQKEQIEAIVRELLTKKEPDIVMQAAQESAKKQRADEEKKSAEALGKSKDKLFSNATDPMAGNAKADVTIVEFFDYNCGYCKKMPEIVKKLIEDDKNVRFVFKDYPILSDSSRLAAKAAIAANMQKKYFEFHVALLEHKGAITQESIDEVAKSVGLNVDQLKKDMEKPEVTKKVDENMALGMDIGAHGTPTFIIGDKVVPGAMDTDELKNLVAEARKAKKS